MLTITNPPHSLPRINGLRYLGCVSERAEAELLAGLYKGVIIPGAIKLIKNENGEYDSYQAIDGIGYSVFIDGRPFGDPGEMSLRGLSVMNPPACLND